MDTSRSISEYFFSNFKQIRTDPLQSKGFNLHKTVKTKRKSAILTSLKEVQSNLITFSGTTEKYGKIMVIKIQL